MIRALLADDDELVRAGMSMIIDGAEDITVVGEAATGRGAVEAARRTRPDVVLMDVQMPDEDGIEATRRITGDPTSEARVLIVTTFELDEYVFRSLAAGASGYLLKRTRPAELLEGIRLVARGDGLLSPSVTRRLIERFVEHPLPDAAPPAALERLTDREREVLVCVARAMNNREIAEELHIGESTAKTHVKRVLMKLGLRDRIHAVVFAYESGLTTPGSPTPDAGDG